MITNEEREFVKELNQLVDKHGMVIDSDGELFILEVEGDEGSRIFFSRLEGNFIIVKSK